MSTTPILFAAHREWSSRPVDERYWNLAELQAAVSARKNSSKPSPVFVPALRFGVTNNRLSILGSDPKEGEQQMSLLPSHWAFTVLCELAEIKPHAPLVRAMPAELAAQTMNWAVRTPQVTRKPHVMLWANGENPGTVRAFNTTTYARLWDETVVKWLRAVTQDETNGWHRPPAYTDDQYPSGLYASDRNIFTFLVNETNRIDDGSDKGLSRGFICWNTEVGQRSFGLQAFLYQWVCGNHIIWGFQNVFTVRMSHVGNTLNERAAAVMQQGLQKYLTAPASAEQAVITAARNKQLTKTKEEAVDLLYRKIGFTLAESGQIVLTAEELGKDPTNAWALVDAATRVTQLTSNGHTDVRNAKDAVAGKILSLVV